MLSGRGPKPLGVSLGGGYGLGPPGQGSGRGCPRLVGGCRAGLGVLVGVSGSGD